MKGCDMDVFLDFHDDEISLEDEEDLKKKVGNMKYMEDGGQTEYCEHVCVCVW